MAVNSINRAKLTSTTVSLAEVLSTCVDAAARGCAEISAVQSRRAAGGELSVAMKDQADVRSALTEADLAAQRVMVGALRSAWPGLVIIGEEDEDESAGAADEVTGPPLRRDLCAELGAPGLEAPLEELCVFVDPLDGTREFVEGRLANVQSLVGLARRGRPVAGAVGLPFAAAAAEPVVVYGLVGAGTGTCGVRPRAATPSGARPLVATGDSGNACLRAARGAALAGGGTAHVVGGAGHKLLMAAYGEADLAIMHFGTSLWDSCAPGAIVIANGGRVTDLFGAPLVHLPSNDLKNGLGVVASAPGAAARHEALCKSMRSEPLALQLLEPAGSAAATAGAQAVEICRDLDGRPLGAGAIGAALGGAPVSRYTAPETGAFRGMMSDGCRLALEYSEVEYAAGGGDAAQRPASLFYKRVVMGDLAAARTKALAAPKKLRRDVRSYAVEAAFLGSHACAELVASGVRLPRAYLVEQRPDEADPIESRFALLLQDFSPDDGWRQEGALSPPAARAALATLARLHAFFWRGAALWRRGGEVTAELTAAVWPAGGYGQPSMQPADQFELLAQKCAAHIGSLGAEFASSPELSGIDLGAMGEALQRVAPAAAAETHPCDAEAGGDAEAAAPFVTLIHGDPKAANLFLRDAPAGGAAPPEVALIDFQWCGFGVAATDVAHHIAAALAPECVSGDGERELLDHYHAELCAALAASGAAQDAAHAASSVISRAQLQTQYESALLDMCRLVFAYQWSRATFGVASLNKNSYNKEVRSAVWLVLRCDALLRKRGAL